MVAVAPKRTTATPSRHVYDAVIVGGQLSGAIAGALLARRGLHVLFLEHDGTGNGYLHEGYLLPYAPFLLPPLKTLVGLEPVLDELGLVAAFHRASRPVAGTLQAILPRMRFDCDTDEAKRAKELARAFPQDSTGFNESWRKLVSYVEETAPFFKENSDFDPDGMIDRYRFKRTLARYPKLAESALPSPHHPATKLLTGLAPFTHTSADPQGVAASRPLGQWLAGPHIYPGGREGLREMFLKRMAELGGDVLANEDTAVAEAMTFEGGDAIGLKLVGNDKIYKTSAVIGATDAAALRRLIADKKRHRALSDLLDGVQVKELLFTVNWVLPERALPRGMGECLMLQPLDPELPEMLVQVFPARKAGATDIEPAVKVVSGSAFVPAATRELGEAHLLNLAARLGEELERLMPFAKEMRLFESVPYVHASGVRGSRLLPHPRLSFEESEWPSVVGLPTRSPVKHVFLASREVLPGLGFEGEVLAAVRAADLVQQNAKKNDPLKRR
ncbi:MAG: desaturase [Myxococcaceae bacterium]|nr:desaturase [Myxococcaceae bacterium]